MTPDQKREAWFQAYTAALPKYAGMAPHPDTNRPGYERSADAAELDADEALRRLERRYLEGRFGPYTQEDPPPGFMPESEALRETVDRQRAELEEQQDALVREGDARRNAEAEVERLKAIMADSKEST